MSTASSSSLHWHQTVNRLNEPISDCCCADEVIQDAWQEMLLWSRALLTVDEIVERFNGKLPIIAMATRGYHDVDDIGGLSLAKGQVSFGEEVGDIMSNKQWRIYEMRLMGGRMQRRTFSMWSHTPVKTSKMSVANCLNGCHEMISSLHLFYKPHANHIGLLANNKHKDRFTFTTLQIVIQDF